MAVESVAVGEKDFYPREVDIGNAIAFWLVQPRARLNMIFASGCYFRAMSNEF